MGNETYTRYRSSSQGVCSIVSTRFHLHRERRFLYFEVRILWDKGHSYRRTFCLNFQIFFLAQFFVFPYFPKKKIQILECEAFQIFCALLNFPVLEIFLFFLFFLFPWKKKRKIWKKKLFDKNGPKLVLLSFRGCVDEIESEERKKTVRKMYVLFFRLCSVASGVRVSASNFQFSSPYWYSLKRWLYTHRAFGN